VNPYSEQSKCPKCWTIGARTEYHNGTGRFNSEGNKLPDEPEYLTRTCVRCGYWWQEEPLDAGDLKQEKIYIGKHIESKDPQAICLCGKQVVEWIAAGSILPAVYRCPSITSKRAG